MPERIYNTAKASLGQHLTLNPAIPQDEGCAESVSTILLKAGIKGIPQRGFAGTWDLYQWLLTNNQFKEVSCPSVGAVVISPRNADQAPDPNRFAHTGICLMYGIGSNDSSNGIFAENYTSDSWVHFFNDIQGLSTHYFQAV